jgi:hypothetical protein
MTKSGCPAAFMPMDTDCEKWNDQILNEVSKNRPEIIFISNLTNSLHVIKKDNSLYDTYFTRGFSKMIAELSKYSRIIVIEDTPYPNFDISNCIISKGYGACSFNQESSDTTLISKSIAEKYKVGWVPTRELFCDGNVCFDSLGKKNLFRDSSHISSFASKEFNSIFKF